MVERTVEIVNQLGLHARAAAKVVHLASSYPCEVSMTYGGQEVDAKSILGLLLLAAPIGGNVVVRCQGELEEEALSKLRELVADRFGEDA